MTFGFRYGTPFGGGDASLDQPQSDVAGPPVVLEFENEPDGGLPGSWSFYAFERDGVGGLDWVAEPDPPTYYRVVDGLGLWQYSRSPAVPGVGNPFNERGVAAGPNGVLNGRNALVTVVARQPALLLDPSTDEFLYDVTVVLRLDPQAGAWVGARMRAEWSSGVWTTPLTLEALSSGDGVEPVVLDSAQAHPDVSGLDVWRNQPNAELQVEVRGTDLTAVIDGVVVLETQVPAPSRSQLAIVSRIYNRQGAGIYPVPAIVGAEFKTLRDFENLGSPPAIPGPVHLDAPVFQEMVKLPITDLLERGLIRRIRGRQFKFAGETEVEVGTNRYRFGDGEVVRITEQYVGQ